MDAFAPSGREADDRLSQAVAGSGQAGLRRPHIKLLNGPPVVTQVARHMMGRGLLPHNLLDAQSGCSARFCTLRGYRYVVDIARRRQRNASFGWRAKNRPMYFVGSTDIAEFSYHAKRPTSLTTRTY